MQEEINLQLSAYWIVTLNKNQLFKNNGQEYGNESW